MMEKVWKKKVKKEVTVFIEQQKSFEIVNGGYTQSNQKTNLKIYLRRKQARVIYWFTRSTFMKWLICVLAVILIRK